MKTAIQQQYNDECPDCFETIADDITHEMACVNCGHVFLDVDHLDDSCVDPTIKHGPL